MGNPVAVVLQTLQEHDDVEQVNGPGSDQYKCVGCDVIFEPITKMSMLVAKHEAHLAQAIVTALYRAYALMPDGYEEYELFAAFKDRSQLTNGSQSLDDYQICSDIEVALRKAKIWGPDAVAAHCTRLDWPDGRVYRTPWQIAYEDVS